MAYEINISKLKTAGGTNRYEHYFATHERSIGLDRTKLKALYNQFKTLFPEPEYNISIMKIETSIEDIDPDKL